MAIYGDMNKLESMIREVEARLRNVENGNTVEPPKETMYARMDREREERKEAVAMKRHAPRPDDPFNMSRSHPTSRKRAEEIQHRRQELNAPNNPQPAPKPTPIPSVQTVEFACWHKNEIARIVLNAAGAPVPLYPT